MVVLRARNVHRALPLGAALLRKEGVARPSRGGDVVEHPEPVATVYERPLERVLFWPQRDANPFFHLFECLHMIAGRNDVAWLAQYNSRMREFSDDGLTFHGAYGHRWRYAFGVDQLDALVSLLRRDPESRRAVLQMWHAPLDLAAKSADLPCNTQAFFKIRDCRLLMTVSCRSNDIVWGAYGANAVHFSFLQEYLAGRIGVGVGPYTQVSDSFHAYAGVWEERTRELPVGEPCPYETGEVAAFPLLAGDEQRWLLDMSQVFQTTREPRFVTPFFNSVVQPLLWAHEAYKAADFTAAFGYVDRCAATDWCRAAREWLERRPSFLMWRARV